MQQKNHNQLVARVLACLTTVLCLLAGSGPARGQLAPKPAPHYYVPEVPADMGPVEFYLITVGVADDVAARFGHTGIRIKNPVEGTDVVFNWGKFYFDDPGFLWKFFRGELDYSMGVRTFKGDVLHYLESGQHLVMEKINLTTRQKRRLMEKIAWNAVPEHRGFRYQYWYKNCATIPRDYLDEVLEGQVRARYFAQPSTKVFRDYVRTNLALTPFVSPLLDIMMNSNIDRPITEWEAMFLPANLRELLLQMPQVDDEGNPIPGTHLLTETKVLLDNPQPMAAPFNDYLVMIAPTSLLLGLALLALALRRQKLGYRLLGAAALTWGLLGGLLGLTLALNWGLSGHPDGWHTANILLFWPVDLLFVPIGVALLRAGGPIKDRIPFVFAGRGLVLGHVVLFAALVALAGVHVIEQNIWKVAAYFGTPLLALSGALFAVAFQKRTAEVAAAQEDGTAAGVVVSAR